jgi:hypothetical protein
MNIHYMLAFRVVGDRSRGLLRFGGKAISMTDTEKQGHSFCFPDKIKQETPRNAFYLSTIASLYPILPLSGISPAWVDW